jgi:hypothetical protein
MAMIRTLNLPGRWRVKKQPRLRRRAGRSGHEARFAKISRQVIRSSAVQARKFLALAPRLTLRHNVARADWGGPLAQILRGTCSITSDWTSMMTAGRGRCSSALGPARRVSPGFPLMETLNNTTLRLGNPKW